MCKAGVVGYRDAVGIDKVIPMFSRRCGCNGSIFSSMLSEVCGCSRPQANVVYLLPCHLHLLVAMAQPPNLQALDGQICFSLAYLFSTQKQFLIALQAWWLPEGTCSENCTYARMIFLHKKLQHTDPNGRNNGDSCVTQQCKPKTKPSEKICGKEH